MCFKYLLFGINFIFSLTEIAVLAISIRLRFDFQMKNIFEQVENNCSFYTGVYILIGAGVLMMIVLFLGCCGAVEEAQCMLGLFFAFLLVIFAIKIAAAIWGYYHKEEVIWEIKEFLKETYRMKTKEGPYKDTPKAIHHALDCCGLTRVLDQLIMDTCPNKDLVILVTMKPCPTAIEEVFNNKFQIVGAVSIGIAVVMIFGMIFSMILFCAIQRNQDMV